MDSSKRVKGHCPECGPDRNADIIACHEVKWSNKEAGMWGDVHYRILQCPACDTVYFQKEDLFSENEDYRRNPETEEWEPFIRPDITHWPVPSRRSRPQWMQALSLNDSLLLFLMEEVYAALNAELRVLAAIGIRTAFDRASELLGIDPSLGFAQKLTALIAAGHIGARDENVLKTLTNAGSAAAHRGWRPSFRELATMMDIIEAFLHRAFILGDAAELLRGGIPPRQKRPKGGQAQ